MLGVFGELDPLTPAQRTTENMREVLTEESDGTWRVRDLAHLVVGENAVNLERTFVIRVTGNQKEWVDVRTGTNF